MVFKNKMQKYFGNYRKFLLLLLLLSAAPQNVPSVATTINYNINQSLNQQVLVMNSGDGMMP